MGEYQPVSLRLTEREYELLNEQMSKAGERNRTAYIKARIFGDSRSVASGNSGELLSKIIDLLGEQKGRIDKMEAHLEELTETLSNVFEEDEG